MYNKECSRSPLKLHKNKQVEMKEKGGVVVNRNVLFLCCENAGPSQLAEAIVKKCQPHHIRAFSAGLIVRPIYPPVKLLIKEMHLSSGEFYSKSFWELIGKIRFDYIITLDQITEENFPASLSGGAHCLFWPVWKYSVTKKGHLPPSTYQKVHDDLELRINNLVSVYPDSEVA